MTAPLSPKQAGKVAIAVYSLKDSSDMGTVADKADLDAQFDIDAGTRLTGNSGYGPVAQSTGFAFLAKGKQTGGRLNEMLLAVRGTASLADGVTDAFTSVRPGATGSGVHAGFSDTYNSFGPSLERQLRGGTRPSCVHVVGHSLGGAVATIAASRISQMGIGVKLYTFGSPRVGLGLFSGACTDRIGDTNIFRVHHTADPVTMVPIFPFLHVPVEGTHYRLPWPSGTVEVGAHFMDNYMASVGDQSWAGLSRAVADNDTLADVEGWLESTARMAGSIAPMNSWMLARVAQCLNWMIQIAGGVVVLVAAGAEFVSDMIAALIMRAANLVARMGTMVVNLCKIILRLIGRTADTVQNVTTTFLSWVLEMLFSTLGSTAIRAIRRIR